MFWESISRLAPDSFVGQMALFGGLYFVFLGIILYVLLCGESANRNSITARAHRFFTRDICRGGSWIIGKICGETVNEKLRNIEQYCCWQRNPFLQIFYLGLILGLFGIVVVASYPVLPNKYVPGYHIYILNGGVILGLVAFLMTSIADPGVITEDNVDKEMDAYPIDNTLYQEKVCKTCKFKRPARSKHCRICNRCVSRFDHHCGWMNTCISRRNYRYFMWYLIHHSILCFYGCWVAFSAIRGTYDDHLTRVNAWYQNKYGQIPVLGVDFIARFVLINWKGQAFGMVVMFVVAVMLGGFFIYHSYLIINNTTTNETYKWEDLRYGLLQHFREKEKREAEQAASSAKGAAKKRGGKGKEEQVGEGGRGGKAHLIDEDGEIVQHAKEFAFGQLGVADVNQYSGTVWENIKEILFCQPANKIGKKK